MARLNCILDASWEHLRGFGRRLEAILRPSSCVLEGLEGVWRAPQQALASSREGLEPFLRGFLVFFRGFLMFFRGLKPKGKISKIDDFPQGKLIFSRVWPLRIEPKSNKKTKLEAIKRKTSASRAKNNVLEAKSGVQRAILEAKRPILEAKKRILEGKMAWII